MRRLVRLAGFILALTICFSLPALADKANTAYKQGVDAEARSNYEQAYEFYKQAYDLKPTEVKYRAAFTRIRFYASASHVHKGQQLRDQGHLEEALAEFQIAVTIDPANFYAGQELKRTQVLIEEQKKNPGQTGEKPPTGLSALAQQAAGPVELHPISNTPITLRMTEDSKVVYTAIGKIAGLNVLFDPDYTSRRITIELNGVSLNQALEIVALESKTFYRPVTPNTVFVASDTPAKRKELEQSVIKTFYLGNVSSPNDLQDAVNTVRQILDVQRIQQVTTQNAIVVRGTPDQIAMAEKLLGDIDKAKPEVVVEIAVMQVRRDKARTLGIQPPTSASVQLAPNVTTSTTSTATGSGGNTVTGNTSTTNNSITLNTLANLNATDFQVTIPAANFSALMTDANTKLIQNPQIRALDNQKATLKIGDRIPVATGSFQPGIGGVGINPLVNTQFQYIDVGVNIDITPRIHADREVTLKLTMEISNVTGQANIGGIQQPIIGQRKIEHEIRLREGEVNLLGGILENSDQVSINGWPFLAKIPILRYLFSQENKQNSENEIVFALVPHIVRGQDHTELNEQAVDVGTATGIELRRSENQQVAPEVQQSTAHPQPVNHPAPAATYVPPTAPQDVSGQQSGVPVTETPQQPSGAANNPNSSVTSGSPPGTAQQPAPFQPPATTPPQAQQQAQPQGSLQAGNAVLSFEPAASNQAVNSTFVVNVSMSNASNVYSVPSQISYDPKVLQLVNVSNGGFLGKDGQPVALVHRDDPATGTLQVTATRPPGSGGVAGQGPVFTLTFMAKAPGQATISVSRAGARDPAMQPIPVAGGQAMITVK
jgi:general secretion pathway protein D